MKRIKWLMLLCAFAVMFAVPAWAENISFDVLQASIDATASNDTLTLESGATYVATETRKSIIISKDITIDGNGATVSGDMTSNDFFISGDNAGITVEIKNLKIRDGKAAFTKQTTQGENMSLGGGGMLVFNTNLTLENVIFTNNVANDNNRPTSYGGGLNVWLDSKDAEYVIKIISCDFISNDALITGDGGMGGALQIRATNYTTASVDIVSCNFKENKAKFASGAAIMTNFIDAVEKTNPAKHLKVSVRDCNFEENTASNSGGGLWIYATRGPLSADVVNCTFTGNVALGDSANAGGGGMEIRTYHGKSTDVRNDTDVNIVNCVFDGNKAIRGGGLLARIMDTETSKNSAKLGLNVKNSTFKANIASVDYGGGILTALHKVDTGTGSDDSKINQVVQNCTFIDNKAKTSGGAMSVRGYDKGSISNTVANSTFVNNSADVAAEIFVETTDGGTTSNDNTVINALIWNDTPNSKDVVVVSGDNSKSKLTVTTSAFQSGALSTDVVSDDASEKDLTFSVNSEDKPINGINHTIVKPTLGLNIGTPHASNDKVPEYDIFGVKRSTSKPTVGAAEYVDDSGYTIVASGDVVVNNTTLSADISTTFDVTFTVSGDVDSTYTVTWSGDIGVAGLTFSSADGKLTGKPTVSADTKFKPVATITTAGGYVVATVSKDFTIKITSADTSEEEGSTSEAITLTASSTDVTVYQGGSIDITVTATSGDNIVWTKSSGDLPSGVTAAASGDKVYTIKGTVSTSADVKAYTYKVIASNDTNVASVDIKITVKAKEAEKETETTEYKLSVTVSPKELSLNRGATSGNTLTATATISPDAKVTPTLQWYSNTTASNSGGTAISSATSATYAAPTSTTGTFYYFVVAKATVSGDALTASSDVVTVKISSSSSSEETDSGDTTPDYANMSADKVAELAVDEDGTISQDVVDALLESLTSSDGAVSVSDVAKNEQLVAIYAASAKAKSGVLSLNTLPLDSLSGIGTLLSNIASANGTTTSTMTLDLSGQDSKLTKVDSLSGVSLKGLSLKGNVNIAEVDLKGATVEKVEMSNSGVATLALDSTSDVKEIDANGSALATIDLASNDKIQSLDIGGTQVSTLNASGCSSLANLAAEGGSSTGTPGDLKELNIEGCESLTNLSVSNNQLLGIKKPSTLKNRVAVSARGQRRPNARFTSSSFNFWNFLWTLLGNTGSYSATTATFNVTKITTITYTVGTTTTSADVPASGDLSFSGTPTGISYEYDTSDFGPSTTSSLQSASVVAADDSGMDVTLGTVASSSGGGGEVTLGSSGGGCDAGFGLGALSAVMLMFALKKKRS